MKTIAALFVDPKGIYAQLPKVDLWDEKRDARNYAGPHPVVAHPPCSRWCRLAGLVEARHGHRKWYDGGLFATALGCVRKWGGVLEHPAYSKAWDAHGLSHPPREGGWVKADNLGGRTCHVEQGRYGHRARKQTWLYAVSQSLPELDWGATNDGTASHVVSWCRNHNPGDRRPRIGKREAAATPLAFALVLLSIASGRRGRPHV